MRDDVKRLGNELCSHATITEGSKRPICRATRYRPVPDTRGQRSNRTPDAVITAPDDSLGSLRWIGTVSAVPRTTPPDRASQRAGVMGHPSEGTASDLQRFRGRFRN